MSSLEKLEPSPDQATAAPQAPALQAPTALTFQAPIPQVLFLPRQVAAEPVQEATLGPVQEAPPELAKPKFDDEFNQRIRDAIPAFTEESLDSIVKKVPSWLAYLMGEIPILNSVTIEKPKKRGRPQKHNLPPPPGGITVNKLSDAVPLCIPLTRPSAERLIHEYQGMSGTPEQRVTYIADAHKLPYDAVQHALRRVI